MRPPPPRPPRPRLILQVLSSDVNFVVHYQVGGSAPINTCTQAAGNSSSSSGSGSSSSTGVLHFAVEAAVTGWVAGWPLVGWWLVVGWLVGWLVAAGWKGIV